MGNTSQRQQEEQLTKEAQTSCGKIVGRKLTVDENVCVNAFQGIPYAKPPLGELRFRKPVSPDPWVEPLRATRFPARSIQAGITAELRANPCSEDCLYLNVFAPQQSDECKDGRPSASLLPVMVYIHGGSFVSESTSLYGDVGIGRHMVAKCRTVVVTVQYRLGLLGFFTVGDPSAECCDDNCALWDMTMALRWVRDNVAAFGGDPTNVTVFGHSAGAASADFLSLSPHSRDLFDKLILMAGCAEGEYTTDINAVETCRKFASALGVKTAKDEELIRRLRGIPAARFVLDKAPLDIDGCRTRATCIIGPRVDGVFFSRSIDELRREAPPKKRLIGITACEGLSAYLFKKSAATLDYIEEFIAMRIPEDRFPADFKRLRREALSMYIDQNGDAYRCGEICGGSVVNFYTDLLMAKNIARSVEAINHRADTYLYVFEHCNPLCMGNMRSALPFSGATHGTELSYLFGVPLPSDFVFTDDDWKVLEVTTRLWTNFSRYGDPNGDTTDAAGTRMEDATSDVAISASPPSPQKIGDNGSGDTSATFLSPAGVRWEPVNVWKPLQYLRIGVQSMMADEPLQAGRCAFWVALEKRRRCGKVSDVGCSEKAS